MTLTQNQIQSIKRYFQDKPVLKAYLFGSFARGDADEQSDVDILVELDYSAHIGLGFVGMKLDLEDQLHRPVDLVSSEGVSDRILPYIQADKTLIYERPHR
ncbi:nucleotidyltransferase [Arsenicibacter rosenii]|uniref:Nucleotidyltransferase n=2 Tax=Arsenicibacter rosenii TaxID=1750698 RepID=A0A1S2VEA7_9BACT|nr:nucleotidyltransferase [Arsenicibacter rosenii]